MSRTGIAISGGPNPGEIVDLVVRAESLGYKSAWVAERHGGDQFAILAARAMRTSRMLLGTSISSVFVRTAPGAREAVHLRHRAAFASEAGTGVSRLRSYADIFVLP